eukprot:2288337-Amphidinium_carterae.1
MELQPNEKSYKRSDRDMALVMIGTTTTLRTQITYSTTIERSRFPELKENYKKLLHPGYTTTTARIGTTKARNLQTDTTTNMRRTKPSHRVTGLQASKNTGVLHLTVNEDIEEKKLTTVSMNLQAWYDDDNTEYTAQELKGAIKEEHNSLQKTEVFQRVKRGDYSHNQLKQVVQTKW